MIDRTSRSTTVSIPNWRVPEKKLKAKLIECRLPVPRWTWLTWLTCKALDPLNLRLELLGTWFGAVKPIPNKAIRGIGGASPANKLYQTYLTLKSDFGTSRRSAWQPILHYSYLNLDCNTFSHDLGATSDLKIYFWSIKYMFVILRFYIVLHKVLVDSFSDLVFRRVISPNPASCRSMSALPSSVDGHVHSMHSTAPGGSGVVAYVRIKKQSKNHQSDHWFQG